MPIIAIFRSNTSRFPFVKIACICLLCGISIAIPLCHTTSSAATAGANNYRRLCSDLTPKEARQIVNSLQEAKIPHLFSRKDFSIMVPASRASRVRSYLERKGLTCSPASSLLPESLLPQQTSSEVNSLLPQKSIIISPTAPTLKGRTATQTRNNVKPQARTTPAPRALVGVTTLQDTTETSSSSTVITTEDPTKETTTTTESSLLSAEQEAATETPATNTTELLPTDALTSDTSETTAETSTLPDDATTQISEASSITSSETTPESASVDSLSSGLDETSLSEPSASTITPDFITHDIAPYNEMTPSADTTTPASEETEGTDIIRSPILRQDSHTATSSSPVVNTAPQTIEKSITKTNKSPLTTVPLSSSSTNKYLLYSLLCFALLLLVGTVLFLLLSRKKKLSQTDTASSSYAELPANQDIASNTDSQIEDLETVKNRIVAHSAKHMSQTVTVVRMWLAQKALSNGFTGPQKTAGLLLSMDNSFTANLFKVMQRQEIAHISKAIKDLEKLPKENAEEILREFDSHLTEHINVISGGQDAVKRLLMQNVDPDAAEYTLGLLRLDASPTPFKDLQMANPRLLAPLLQHEHPQTVGLILGYLPADQAAVWLTHLPSSNRAEILHRLATLESVSEEMLLEVDTVLKNQLAAIASKDEWRMGGTRSVAEILNAVDKNTQDALLSELSQDSTEMANDIHSKMFLFEDCAKLDNKNLREILSEINNETLTLALHGATEELRQRIFRNMPESAAELLKKELNILGSIPLIDVEAAQQKIVKTARRLEQEKRVILQTT